MKNNQEIAASVFEKSRIVLQKRAVRRKRIATAASTLSAAAVITVAALLSKGAFTRNIPTQDPPVISDNSSAASSSSTSSLGTTATASAVTSSSPSEESRTESKTESSKSGSSSKESVSSDSSKQSSRASSSTASAAGSSASVSSGRSSDTAHEAESKKSDSSKTTGSKASSSKNTSSKTTSSKATSSKTTSSKTTSSKTTSSKTTSSKTTSSKTASSESASIISSRNPYNQPADTDAATASSDVKDEDRPVPDALDEPDAPGDEAPVYPTEKNPNDFSDGEPGIPDTDAETADINYEFVSYYGEIYRNADDLVREAQLVIVGDVSKILFTRGSEDLAPLRNDFDPSGSDLYTVVTVDISDVLQGKAHSDRITFTMYGGMIDTGTYTVQQTFAGWDNAVPLVECREDPELYERYIFVLDFNYESGRWTLHTYQDGIISVDHPNGVIMPGDMLQACRD